MTIYELDCGVTYTIIAGGIHNGRLVGPLSDHGNITGSCFSSELSKNGDGGNYQNLQHLVIWTGE